MRPIAAFALGTFMGSAAAVAVGLLILPEFRALVRPVAKSLLKSAIVTARNVRARAVEFGEAANELTKEVRDEVRREAMEKPAAARKRAAKLVRKPAPARKHAAMRVRNRSSQRRSPKRTRPANRQV